jgi:hypothetical protein
MGQRRLEAAAVQEKEPTKKSVQFNLPTTSKGSGQQRKRKANFVDGWDEELPEKRLAGEGEKREIGYDVSYFGNPYNLHHSFQIQKNKGLVQKRKKEARHSRVKRRAQYKKALVKRRSQVPDVKRETSKYSGESRGIRMSTVRSIQFKA